MATSAAPLERRRSWRGLPELALGAAAVALAVELLSLAESAMGGGSSAWGRGLWLTIGAALQALPALGVLVFGRDRFLPDQRRAVTSVGGGALRLVVAAFALSFFGVFALLHSLAFMPIVALALFTAVFMRRLVRRERAWYAAWWLLSVGALAAGLAALRLPEHMGWR